MRAPKQFFLLFCILSMGAFAQVPQIEIENFQANYVQPNGSGSANTFVYEGLDYGNSFEVDLQAGELVLSTEQDEFRLSSLPSQVSDWKSLNIEKVDLKSNSNFIELRSERIEYTDIEDKEGYISKISIDCENQSKGILESVLDMCLNQKMTFYVPFIGGVSLNNINIWTDKNKLNFSLKNGVWIKGYGTIFYEEANKLIRVRIDKAKAGFLNVTGRVFSELKGLENDYVKVNRPWVEISLP